MKSLGGTLRALRENRQLPLRRVAARLDIACIEQNNDKNWIEAVEDDKLT
jgi:cytoskeletal protein RodZ